MLQINLNSTCRLWKASDTTLQHVSMDRTGIKMYDIRTIHKMYISFDKKCFVIEMEGNCTLPRNILSSIDTLLFSCALADTLLCKRCDDLEAGGKRPVIMPMPQADFVLVDSFQLLGYGSSITKCFQRSCKLQCGS